MFAKINSMGLLGLNAYPVYVEIEASRGLESLDIVGLADVAVKESRERIKSAFRSSGVPFPKARLMVNLAPADVKKSGSVHDLSIAVAILSAQGLVTEKQLDKSAFIGEVSLGGEIRPVSGVLPMTLMAKSQGITEVFVPKGNAFEASVVDGIAVYGVESLSELILHLGGKALIEPMKKYEAKETDYFSDLDFADVKGQQTAKKALEIAACGGHNVLMVGAPGSGKSMLAKRMPSILPQMTFEESVETTNIHSISGILNPETPLVTKRPFRSPHHTISPAGLSGGGSVPRPGEISLAHNGLLFLDELAEFSRQTLEILRQPLEDQKVTISRVSGSITYPCSIMLIAAMNPCPCGYYGHPTKKCICSQKQVSNYLSKISGPVLDRFDIHLEVAPVEYDSLSSTVKEESSAQIRERVQRAREIQNERYKGTSVTCNARITSDIIHEVCVMTDAANDMLRGVFDRLGLSARAYDRILKVARTIADMDNSPVIDKKHIAQAVQYRSLDRKYWN
ncbi:MAG: YifB family Mg chelatase-like AAA ATPase [Oscillospiraceae bacterium]|nr:YifB family Mg chelatase-like AAA ATPase [Oscillospiraceae bacterium]